MASLTRFHSFIEALAEKKHNLASDTLTIALTNAQPVAATNTVLADITQITYTNLSSRVLTVTDSSNTAGVYKLTVADLLLTSTGGATGPFRYIVVYNDTATNDELIGYYDYGSSITLNTGESLNLDFDGVNGTFTIG